MTIPAEAQTEAILGTRARENPLSRKSAEHYCVQPQKTVENPFTSAQILPTILTSGPLGGHGECI